MWIQKSVRALDPTTLKIGCAFVGAGIFFCLKAFYSWPDSDTPAPYKEWTKPATPMKRALAASLGFLLIVAGGWLIRISNW